MQNAKLLFIIIAILLLVGAGIILVNRVSTPINQPGTERMENQQQFIIGQKAADFVLKDFKGNEVRLSDFYGKKAVILDFWAAWCPFCVEEMPELEKVHQTYQDNLVMIGVHRTDSGEAIETGKKFADEQGVTYLLVQGTAEIYRASTKGLNAMPVAVFLDKNGVVEDIKIGPKTEEEIKKKVEKLIK